MSEAAAAYGLSVSRLQKMFAETTNMTFARLCLRARLSFAAHRLMSTDRPISASAAEAGFADDSHLHRCFAKEYKCTPAEHRGRAVSAREQAAGNGGVTVGQSIRAG